MFVALRSLMGPHLGGMRTGNRASNAVTIIAAIPDQTINHQRNLVRL
jgi:hypothetical protein